MSYRKQTASAWHGVSATYMLATIIITDKYTKCYPGTEDIMDNFFWGRGEGFVEEVTLELNLDGVICSAEIGQVQESTVHTERIARG